MSQNSIGAGYLFARLAERRDSFTACLVD